MSTLNCILKTQEYIYKSSYHNIFIQTETMHMKTWMMKYLLNLSGGVRLNRVSTKSPSKSLLIGSIKKFLCQLPIVPAKTQSIILKWQITPLTFSLISKTLPLRKISRTISHHANAILIKITFLKTMHSKWDPTYKFESSLL